MSTRYLEILAVQRPFPFNVDANQRVMFSCNYDAVAAAPVGAFEQEIIKILTDTGLATLGTDTFVGPDAPIPKDLPGPFITVLDTGGIFPLETHNGDKYERMSFQIVVRAKSYVAARARALAIWRALDGQRNITVTA